FTYFVEQIGFDCFPWVFAFPGAATVLARVRLRPATPRERAMLFLLLWFLIGFAVFAFSATKFHHYAFPVLAPLLFFCALWLVRSLRSRERRAAIRAAYRERMAGAPLTAEEAPQDRRVVVWSLVALALAFAVFCGWFHWRRLSPHWTQRDLFWEYYQQSTPD